MSNLERQQAVSERLRICYGVLARQTELLKAIALAMESLSEHDRYYQQADELRGIIASLIILNCERIWRLSNASPEEVRAQ